VKFVDKKRIIQDYFQSIFRFPPYKPLNPLFKKEEWEMKRFLSLLAALTTVLAVAAFAFALAPAQTAQSDSFTLMEFNIMHGAPRPYAGAGAADAIRGVAAGGLPWVLTAANGELKGSGHLEIRVKGLVFDPNAPGVIAAGRAGDNPVPNFVAIVSCQTVVNGLAAVVNVTSPAFPATTGLATDGGGNASFEGNLSLPSPCLAPIVFVGPNSGTWFAVTGH